MGQMYSASFANVAVTATVDFFEILAPSDASIIIHEIHIGQETEEGDSQAEMLSWGIYRGEGATSGSGGGTATPEPVDAGMAASGATVETNNDTQASAGGGSLTQFFASAFHVAAGLHYVPTPGARPVISGGDFMTITLDEAPADSIDFYGSVIFEEIGG